MNRSLILAAVAITALGGCAYPVYQPAPIARLSTPVPPARPLTDAERAQLAAQNAQIQRDDQADIDAQRQAQAYSYVYPAAPSYYYTTPYPYYGYYGGYYPWAPALSLSFGYSRGWGGYRGGWGGYRGGFHGGGGWHR